MTDTTDVVVVGAGLVGLAVAWELARARRRVVVAERGVVAGGTTGASFAWLNATSKTEEAYHRLNAAGLARHLELARLWGEKAVGLHGAGVVTWSEPGAAIPLEQVRRDFETLRGFDYPCLWLGRRELQALEPHVAFGDGAEGLLAPRDRWLDAPRLARRLAEEIVAAGGELREHTAVSAIRPGADGVTVTAGRSEISCGHVVIAAGPGTAEVVALVGDAAPAPFPVGRVPGLLVNVPPDPARTPVNHIVYAPDAGNFHVRPTPEGGLLLGDDVVDGLIGEDADTDTLRRATRALFEVAGRHLTHFPAGELIDDAEPCIGVRPMPADGRTIAGPLPGAPGVFVAATHSGITLAPVLGELLAREIATGAVPRELLPFRPDRFAGG